jgi:hypothetical protein
MFFNFIINSISASTKGMSTGAPVNFSFSSPQECREGVPNFEKD